MKLPEGFRRAPPPALGGPGDGSDGIDDEIRFHLESRTAELVERGMDEARASRIALAEFGDPGRTARAAWLQSTPRGRWRMRMGRSLGEVAKDVRGALRQGRRNPGLAFAAVLTLALGVGGTTAVYSVVEAVLLRPLPYPDEGRVVRIWPGAPGDQDGARELWSIPDLDDWRTRSGSLAALGAYTTQLGGMVVRSSAGTPEEVSTTYVTRGFFEALGTPAAIGRALPSEAEVDDPRVVVLSDGLWRRRFGGDPGVVGSTLDTHEGGYRIVGVMPPEFAFPGPETELWTFLANVDQASVPWRNRAVRVFEGIARVAAVGSRPADDRDVAASELGAVAEGIARDFPETNAGITSVELLPLREAIVGDVRTPLWLVAGAVALTLLIACVNVANLLLARGAARRHEFTVRSWLGAGRGRLVRQVLAEGLVLGLVGGAAGVLFARLAVPALAAGARGLLPRADTVSVDLGVLAFALALSVGTGLLVGLLPALRTAGGAAGSGMRGRGASDGLQQRGLLSTLVFAEVGLAVVLLVGGGLLVRSLDALGSVDPGFDPDGLLVAEMVVSGYETSEEYLGFRDRFLDRLAALPGVVGATTAKEFPTRGVGEAWPWERPGDPPARPGEERTARALHVHRDFFEVMRIPLVRGTLPGADAEVSLVVNEHLAREAFGSAEAAVGSLLRVAGIEVPVRAVVGDVLHTDPAEAAPPMVYVDDRINARRVFAFIVRTDGDPLALSEPFRRSLAGLDDTQPVRALYTARSAYEDAVRQPRFFAVLMSLFAVGATLLAAVGIHGVIAYSVRRRTREIGVRVALGADRSRVGRLVLWGALRPVVAGLGVGLAGAAALSTVLSGMLFGVGRVDPVTYLGVAALFLAVAVSAAWAPAREATRIDPREALRAD